jgi:hypothetical protein
MMKCYWEAPTAASTERFIVEYTEPEEDGPGRVAPDPMAGGEKCHLGGLILSLSQPA